VRELALYVAAGVAYVVLGVAVPELLFSWIEGAVFLVLAVWVLPALVERLR
jgi:putative Ca2+/H+ antiporter (TMEM165/GDT1 family)